MLCHNSIPLLLFLFVCYVKSDMYLHNPRGSNNRLNEATRNRANANRMFDSQNNNRGGYNVGSLYYYVGSKVRVEWTNQHSCGDQNNHCDVIIQYMCGKQVRDGTKTNTIPTNQNQCDNNDCNSDYEYGMHEDFYSYAHCKLRTRNKGLFTADQNVGNGGTKTRQNPKGTRRGYECPEERDYYPYWGPTPWRDIVIFTNDIQRCKLYLKETQNVKPKFACKVGKTYLRENENKNPGTLIPITKEKCEAFQYKENGKTKKGEWQIYPSHNIPAPECLLSQASRDNHLGNGLGGETLNFNWTVPNDVNERCAMRIRYNISTSDYDRDNTFSTSNNQGNTASGVDIWSRHDLSEAAGKNRGYKLKNDPTVDVFESPKLPLQLAINTAQFGRVFQDRSHYFAIRAKPSELENAKIENINVRGKRGNIVQVYPGVEYDFVPNKVMVSKNTYVHFQWTGSDTNPTNNDGQGRQQTDRSNVVPIRDPTYREGSPELFKKNTYGQLGANYPRNLSGAVFAGFDFETLWSLAVNKPQLGGDMEELDDSGTYYDLGPRKVTQSGTYNYMSTRNNNFSNRSQKGTIIILNAPFVEQSVDQRGGSIALKNPTTLRTVAIVDIPSAAFSRPTDVQVWQYSKNDNALPPIKPENKNYLSDFVYVMPAKKLSSEADMKVQFLMNAKPGFLSYPEVYRSNSNDNKWEKVKIEKQEGRMITVHSKQGGYFVACNSLQTGLLAGLIVGVVVAILLLVAVLIFCCKNQELLKGYGAKV